MNPDQIKTLPVIHPLGYENPDTEEVKSLIAFYADLYGVDLNLSLLLAEKESNFNSLAANPASSARGVYQFLLASTWQDYCSGNIFNAEDNISCALRLLGEGQLQHWLISPDIEKILMANCLITPELDGRIYAECF